MNNLYATHECVDHPLGILCRCEEYKEIVDEFVVNTVGTKYPKNPYEKTAEAPLAKTSVVWTLQKAEANANPTKPVIYCDRTTDDVSEIKVDKMWVPVNPNLVPATELRPNMSYLHRTAQNTQTADISVLTDMLPHQGHATKRKDIDWDIGSHEKPPKMTDEPEMKFYSVKGCFSTWAEVYTRATGRPAY